MVEIKNNKDGFEMSIRTKIKVTKQECFKCKEKIKFTDVFSYCPKCLTHQ